MLTASDVQLQRAAEQQSQALQCVPSYAALGPMPTQQDLAAAATAAATAAGSAAAGGAGEGSDTSASTVPFMLLQPPPVFSQTLCTRVPEGYQAEDADRLSAGVSGLAGNDIDSEAAVSSRKRRREDAAEAVAAVAASLEGSAELWLLPEQQQAGAIGVGRGDDSVCVCIECIVQDVNKQQQQQQQQHGQGGARAAMALAAGQPAWKRLKAVLPGGDPHKPPVLLRTSGQLLPSNHATARKTDGAASAAAADGPSVPSAKAAETEIAAVADGAVVHQQLQVGLSGLVWDELQVLLQEEPVADLDGAAKRWCAAVKVIWEAQK
jgi:hypothetical protein